MHYTEETAPHKENKEDIRVNDRARASSDLCARGKYVSCSWWHGLPAGCNYTGFVFICSRAQEVLCGAVCESETKKKSENLGTHQSSGAVKCWGRLCVSELWGSRGNESIHWWFWFWMCIAEVS